MTIRNWLFLSLLFCLASPAWSQSAEPASAPPASAVPALPADIPATAERYSFLMMGNLAGQQAVWTAPDGALHLFFQFNDRGRGPKTTSVLKLDSAGIPLSETIQGNDYLKSPVNEMFTAADGSARWKNNAEQGEKKISAPAYYVPLNGAPSETALLVQAALRNGGKIALLPAGEARAQRETALDVEADSRKKHVALYSIAGLDFAPTYIWLEESDKAQGNDNSGTAADLKFFGSVNDWGSTIPEGWESAVKPLLAAQDEVKDSRAAKLAVKLAHPPVP